MNLDKAKEGIYIVAGVKTGDSETDDFLFRLGVYEGEEITLVNKKKRIMIISVKDARYCIDEKLASRISVREKGESAK